jgi:AraC-like DNA-binding protein
VLLTQPDHFGPRLFRTGAIPPSQRFAAWHEVVNGWLLGVESNPVSDAPFSGSACLRVLPELRFGWGALGGTRNRRTRTIVARDDDDLFLFVNTGGRLSASQHGRETEIGSGGAYLMSCSDAGTFQWPENMKLTVVRTRHDAVASLVRNVYDNVGRAIAADNEGLRLLVRYLHALHDAEPFKSPDMRALVTRHVQDLLALMLGASGDARELASKRGLRAARTLAIKSYVEEHLARPELSPEIVARRFHISARTVQRLFESEGSSFSEYLLARRLAEAYSVLGDLHNGQRGIGDVALACGFGNISYFNRRFRSRFGVTPSDIRNRDVLHETGIA